MNTDLSAYLGSAEHLASLGNNYAENGLPREIPVQWQGKHDTAFYDAYDAYRLPDFLALPYLSETAVYASEASGDTRTDRYARDICTEATEYVSNPDWGESVSLVEISQQDQVSLCVLSAIDRTKTYGAYGSTETDWTTCEPDPEGWKDVTHGVVYVSSSGIAYPTWHTSEEEARADYEARADDPAYRDEEDEDEEEASVCVLCNGPHESPEDGLWSDLCERHNPLLGSVKRTESYGGTE